MENFRKFLLSMSIIFALILAGIGYMIFMRLDEVIGLRAHTQTPSTVVTTEPPRTAEEQRIIESLPPHEGYKLRRNATGHQLELFELLIHGHNRFNESGSEIDLQNYAEAVARNFIADFFTLSNKTSRTDVGGLQFFAPDAADEFLAFAMDEFYLYLNQHIENYGQSALPTVATTTIKHTEFTTYFIPESHIGDIESVPEDQLVHDYFWNVIGMNAPVIQIDIQWTYETTTLWQIRDFQTEARLILRIDDEQNVVVYSIFEIPEEIVEETVPVNPW